MVTINEALVRRPSPAAQTAKVLQLHASLPADARRRATSAVRKGKPPDDGKFIRVVGGRA
ncbi:hypothetical protein QTI17_01300 [Variovorax sp. J31P179]|uniref:hypothetical protein n=1 Tax=Variovorax sp. J31P179 TaxID=3053508 RepID=UPI002575854A|nr:hypothetical protein [Variovorax sp. J31P179]MDM0079217.1 hypothetical protein [Variovorax sp. J31P179]